MKKVDEGISIRLKYVHIYRDDIENIYNLFADTFDEVGLIIGDYGLDNLEDIDKINDEKVEKLKIRTPYPGLYLDIDKYDASIYSSESDNIKYGFANRISDILSKRQNKLKRILEERYLYWLIGFWVVYPSILVVNNIFELNSQVYVPLLSALIVIFITIAGYNIVGGYSVIDLNYKKDAPSFFKRNRDQLIVELIVGIVLIVVGILIGIIIGKSLG